MLECIQQCLVGLIAKTSSAPWKVYSKANGVLSLNTNYFTKWQAGMPHLTLTRMHTEAYC